MGLFLQRPGPSRLKHHCALTSGRDLHPKLLGPGALSEDSSANEATQLHQGFSAADCTKGSQRQMCQIFSSQRCIVVPGPTDLLQNRLRCFRWQAATLPCHVLYTREQVPGPLQTCVGLLTACMCTLPFTASPIHCK